MHQQARAKAGPLQVWYTLVQGLRNKSNKDAAKGSGFQLAESSAQATPSSADMPAVSGVEAPTGSFWMQSLGCTVILSPVWSCQHSHWLSALGAFLQFLQFLHLFDLQFFSPLYTFSCHFAVQMLSACLRHSPKLCFI